MVIFAQSLSTNKKLVEKVRLCYKRVRNALFCLLPRLVTRVAPVPALPPFLLSQESTGAQATGKHLDNPKQSEQKIL
jgi:hypothetical protein